MSLKSNYHGTMHHYVQTSTQSNINDDKHGHLLLVALVVARTEQTHRIRVRATRGLVSHGTRRESETVRAPLDGNGRPQSSQLFRINKPYLFRSLIFWHGLVNVMDSLIDSSCNFRLRCQAGVFVSWRRFNIYDSPNISFHRTHFYIKHPTGLSLIESD
jgi:hypothetical protein